MLNKDWPWEWLITIIICAIYAKRASWIMETMKQVKSTLKADADSSSDVDLENH